MDLFETAESNHEPLASRMRPRTLDDLIGQEEIVGQGRLLRRAIQADQLSSVIFYGPPGTGKTTIARIIAGTTKSQFLSLNAVLGGVKLVREAIEQAQEARKYHNRKTILFVDEVHRWNKAQQDALLPWVENGTVILIGATTENPYFEVNSALVSRSRIFQLKSLTEKHLFQVAQAAVKDPIRGYGKWNVSFEEGALNHLVDVSGGDARTLLNALQLAVETTPETFPPPEGDSILISLETAEESIQRKAVLYDKEGDYHFDTISAFIKSIRGSDPDAVLYWLALMIKAGEDPRFILRRMLISATEDIGLADPQALVITNSAAQAFDRMGMPEGVFPLTQAALYLATAPKSNSNLGIFDAMDAVDKAGQDDVPKHLKDSNRDGRDFGHGRDYKYPHAYRNHWVAQQYLPSALKERIFYTPGSQGFEKNIQDDVLRRREMQIAAVLDSEDIEDEILSTSPGGERKTEWMTRSLGRLSENRQVLRKKIFEKITINRHSRVLVLNENSGLLLFEAYRKTPEGSVLASVPRVRIKETLEHLCQTIPEIERPVIIRENIINDHFIMKIKDVCGKSDAVVGVWNRLPQEEREAMLSTLPEILEENGSFSFAITLPGKGTRLSEFLKKENRMKLSECEDLLYNSLDKDLGIFRKSLENLCSDYHEECIIQKEERFFSAKQLDLWLSSSGKEGTLGSFLNEKYPESLEIIRKCLEKSLLEDRIPWERRVLLMNGKIK